MKYYLALFAALIFTTSADAWEPCRVTGRLNSIVPSDGLVLVVGTDGEHPNELAPVNFAEATVVRVSRHVAHPWLWQTRPTHLHRWRSGTFLVIGGHIDRSGVIWADRIEIPKPDGH